MASVVAIKSGSALDESFMRAAFAEAIRARDHQEVPVGAIVVLDGLVLGRGSNQPIHALDPTAHAEIVALRNAASKIGNYRLSGATLYVTVEPCVMCVGSLVHARVARLVYGAAEPRAGAVCSAFRLLDQAPFNHRVEVIGGVLESECRQLMQEFFAARRMASAPS
jgi:tRNA(adenine34) deaminase